MQTVLLTGGTGLIGRQLTSQLNARGYRVIILTRNLDGKTNSSLIEYATWDVKKQLIDHDALKIADFVIHLAGAGVVDDKWTNAYKQEIVESRTKSAELITQSLKNKPNKVKAIISASAIGWYGADRQPGYAFTETDKAATDFLGNTCKLWEQSLDGAGVRVCKLRTGIVLSKTGGALAEFKKPINMGIAGILSDGNQVISWIHIEDLCRMYIYAIEHENLSGSYNAVAPLPVSNKTLTLTLAKAIRGKKIIPMHVPAFMLKLMMGDRSIEVLKSTTVSADKIKTTGFTFLYPSIEAAIMDLTR